MIAPGAYVSFDVPDKAVVTGNPAEIKSYAGSEHYVSNIALEPAPEKQSPIFGELIRTPEDVGASCAGRNDIGGV